MRFRLKQTARLPCRLSLQKAPFEGGAELCCRPLLCELGIACPDHHVRSKRSIEFGAFVVGQGDGEGCHVIDEARGAIDTGERDDIVAP